MVRDSGKLKSTALLTTSKTPSRIKENFDASPPFLRTPCGRSARESSRGSGSIPLWRPAFQGSFREESEALELCVGIRLDEESTRARLLLGGGHDRRECHIR